MKQSLIIQQSMIVEVVSSVLHPKPKAKAKVTGESTNLAALKATPKEKVVGVGAALVSVMSVMTLL